MSSIVGFVLCVFQDLISETIVSASKFGACKCGEPKSAHSQSALTSPPPAAATTPSTPSLPLFYHGPCDSFTVDMNAQEFGSCTCGFKKMDHGKPKELFMSEKQLEQIAKKPPAPPPLVVAAAAPAVPPPTASAPPAAHKKHDRPCNKYEVDVHGTTFGFCKCGFSKDDHRQAGTFVEPELKVFAGGHLDDPKRATIAAGKQKHPGKQVKPCSDYQVDMAGRIFGDCLCGHAKMKHREFNPDLEEEESEPEEVKPAPKIIVRDGTHPCEQFELDMKNTGGYGACLCGFTRLDHEQFSVDPFEWQKVKDSLTAPKEFI